MRVAATASRRSSLRLTARVTQQQRTRATHEDIRFHHVVTSETERVPEDPRNWDLMDAREFKAVVAQVYGMDPTGRIHHAQSIAPALLQK